MRNLFLPMLALAGGLATACDSGNPVAPAPAETPSTGAASTYSITLTASPASLAAGATSGSSIAVSVVRADNGQAPADGSEVILSTDLGDFGTDGQGQAIQLMMLALNGGSATTTFFAPEETGTASLLAQFSDTTQQLAVAIMDTGDPPVASFTSKITDFVATFADTSTGNPTAWAWDFGDCGTNPDACTSTAKNPTHVYQSAGDFVVTLTATNDGGSSSQSQIVSAPSGSAPVAEFIFQIEAFRVTFTDTSTGNPGTWSWDFGDSSAQSTSRSPAHTYTTPGTYTVSLTVTNAAGSDTRSQFVTVPTNTPVAEFTFDVNGFAVTFTDASSGSPTAWSWNFGDGSGTSAERSPVYTYTAAGTFTVSLTVSSDAGSDTRRQVVTVPSGDPPMADFTFAVSSFQVTFADASTGNPTSWSWNFGDGSTSAAQNPSHDYTAAGAGDYTVVLTATNDVGSSTKSQVVSVPTGDAPVADFTFAIDVFQATFADASTGNPTSWSWNFGDGSTSTAQNPSHDYTAAGAGDYTVVLTATNNVGSNTKSQVITVPSGDAPVADFTFAVDDFQVTFADASTGNPTSWSWNFGDGTNSTDQNPSHDYTGAGAGNYTVALTATNSVGSSTKSQLVTVPSGEAPAAAFTLMIDGFLVTFADASTGSPTSWAWDFGDGTSSTDQSPVHDYTTAGEGTYTVRLTVTNAAGSSTANEFVTISAGEPPAADFSFDIVGCVVTFTDSSTENPTAWSWNFGDGGTSAAQNPLHTYPAENNYTVTLTVTNAAGSASRAKAVSVTDCS